ncbi:alpha/beta hydrolase [Pseudonocardia acaciae]|uniref:alpha/beta hydrolase n=1 Tax=Pseudonocardia acaciae TaxID=551276 RepID=UPI0012EE4725|nr:alpha/beta hydrolase [Pseudonocardia acaciae]
MRRSAGRGRGPAGLGKLAVAVAAAGLALCSCTVGPSTRPPVAVQGPSAVDGAPEPPQRRPPPPPGPVVPVPDVGRADAVDFIDCTEDLQAILPVRIPSDRPLRFECADIPVDADSDTGRRRQSSIGLMRASLDNQPPGTRPPLLILGDSDGETGTTRAARLAATVPASLLSHFDLIGMDRRGEGTSRLDCAPPDLREDILNTDVSGPDPRAVDRLLEDARQIVQECYLTEGDTLTRYDTAHTVQDVERARRLLGVRTLSALGLGDGARALSVWAQGSPSSVGRVVLDSPPDPTQDAIGAAEARATAAEATFDAFAKDCAARPGCPLGADPRATLRQLAEQLRNRPEPGPDGDQLTGTGMLHAVLIGLDDPEGWPALTAAIAEAQRGSSTGLLRYLDQMVGLNGRFDLSLATTCNDTTQRVSPPQVTGLIAKWRTDHPVFGAVMAQRLLMCTAWPVPAEPARPGPANGAPPMLVLATALSPRQPLQGYQRAADQLAPARVVNWQGAGRGAYPRTPCVTSAVDALWVNGTVPPASVLCPP